MNTVIVNISTMLFVVVVQLLSGVQLFVTPLTAAYQAPLSFTIPWSLLKFISIELVMISNHLIHFHPLLLLPSIFPSIRVFSNECLFASGGQSVGTSELSISPSNEHSGLILFRIDWFELLVVERNSQKSSPKKKKKKSSPGPEFENISSLVLNLFYMSHYIWILEKP